jgi:hypothetical protein
MFTIFDTTCMIIIANTVHGIFSYTVYNTFITSIPIVEVDCALPTVELIIHPLLLIMQYYLIIQV